MDKTDSAHWDRVHTAGGQPLVKGRELTKYKAVHCRMRQLLKESFEPGHKTVLEIGCAPGGWLIFFNRALGYSVYGVDYSEVGCKRTQENLARESVPCRVICSDVRDPAFLRQYEGFFDVVYSFGVIEHFEDPTEILAAHSRLLRAGGTLLITMPNFGDGTLYRRCWRGLDEAELLRTHNVRLMGIESFRQHLERLKGIEIQTLGYVGPITLYLADKWQYLGRAADALIGYATFFLRSRRLSSTLIFIGKKAQYSVS